MCPHTADQSPGTKKLASSVLGIAFTLGQSGLSGCPPGDPEGVQSLKADLNLGPALQQARIIPS
jgi:hypothetical protein